MMLINSFSLISPSPSRSNSSIIACLLRQPSPAPLPSFSLERIASFPSPYSAPYNAYTRYGRTQDSWLPGQSQLTALPRPDSRLAPWPPVSGSLAISALFRHRRIAERRGGGRVADLGLVSSVSLLTSATPQTGALLPCAILTAPSPACALGALPP